MLGSDWMNNRSTVLETCHLVFLQRTELQCKGQCDGRAGTQLCCCNLESVIMLFCLGLWYHGTLSVSASFQIPTRLLSGIWSFERVIQRAREQLLILTEVRESVRPNRVLENVLDVHCMLQIYPRRKTKRHIVDHIDANLCRP